MNLVMGMRVKCRRYLEWLELAHYFQVFSAVGLDFNFLNYEEEIGMSIEIE